MDEDSGPGGSSLSAENAADYSYSPTESGSDPAGVGALSMAASAPNVVGTGTPGSYLVDSQGNPVLSTSYGMRGEYVQPADVLPAATLAKAAERLGLTPEQVRAFATSSELGGSRMSTTGLDRGTLEMMQRAGLGNEPISSTQTVDQALASMKTGEFLDKYGEDIFTALGPPGSGMVLSGAKVLGGLASGSITPGQAITQVASAAVATSLGLSPGTFNAILNGDFGKAAANTVLGMVAGRVSESSGLSPTAVGIGMQETGLASRIGSAVSGAIGNKNFGTLDEISKTIDQGISGLGISLPSFGGASSSGGAQVSNQTGGDSSDLVGAVLGITGNIIGTEGQADAASSAAARGGSAAKEAAVINAAAAKEVQDLQARLRAPYTQLGSAAAQQYATLLGPGGPLGKPFSMADATNTGVMQQAQRAASEATQQSAASRGGLLTSATQEALQRRAGDIGAQYQNQAFNQYIAQQQALSNPLQFAMNLGAGQTSGEAGTSSEAIMSAGQGAANAVLAEAGLLSAADIARANMRAGHTTNTIVQLIQTGVLRGLLNPSGTQPTTTQQPAFQLPSLSWQPNYSFVPDAQTTPTYNFSGGGYGLDSPDVRFGMGGSSVRLGV